MKILAIGDFHGKFPARLKKRVIKEKPDLIIGVGDYTGVKEWYRYLMKVFKLLNDGKPIPTAKEFFGKEKYRELLKKDEVAARKVLSEFDGFNIKTFFIFGNSDDEWYNYPFGKNMLKAKKRNRTFVKKLKNMKEMTYSTLKLKGINFIGFGGYMDIDEYLKERIRNKEDRWRREGVKKRRNKSKKRLFKNIKETAGRRIFVFHYPPKGIFDKIKDKENPRHGTSAGISFFTNSIRKFKPRLVLCGHMHEYQGKKNIGDSIVVNPGSAGEGRAAVIDFDENKGKVESVRFVK